MLLTWLQQTPGWVLPGASLDMNFAAGTYYPAGVGSVLTTTRAQTVSSYAQTSTGLWVAFAANIPRITNQGLLVEQAATNKCTNFNANPTDLTNMTKGGDAAATLAVVDDTAALAAAGLQNIATSGKVYKLDNSGGSLPATASPQGPTGNTNTHAFSVFSRGAGDLGQDSTSVGSVPLVGTTSYARTFVALTPTGSSVRLRLRADAGQIVFFILSQMEESAFATSPIVVAGASATRAADKLEWAGVALPILRSATGWARAAFPFGSKVVTSSASILSRQLNPDDAFIVPNASTGIRALSSSSGVATATIGGAGTWTGRVVGAVTWDGTGVSIAGNGGTVNAGATPFSANPTTLIFLGSNDGATSGIFINNYIERVTFGTGAKLTSAQVQALAQ